jgi:5-oxoprolinase (ATP-hydrolysing) subunit C
MITILKAAVQTTVQDLGRHGLRHLGVGAAGAMDRLALMIGNYLVGNTEDAAGLELCMPPARIRLDADCAIALTGADCSARLDDTPLDVGRGVVVEAGQTLHLSAARSGVRAYLCLSGGIDVPQVLGSRSTDLSARIGGLEGRVLRDGDALTISQSALPSPAPASVLLPQMGSLIRVIPGPDADGFVPDWRDALVQASWKITHQSNRMGYRLDGPALIRGATEELRSHAVFPGVIQVPAGGAPIVLMADAQATGGYPRIASVIAADQWRLAQIAPGMAIQFVLCTREEALLALRKQHVYLQRVQRSLRAH